MPLEKCVCPNLLASCQRIVLYRIELHVCVHCEAAGHFEVDFDFVPYCNVHTNLKVAFSEKICALESGKYGTPGFGLI